MNARMISLAPPARFSAHGGFQVHGINNKYIRRFIHHTPQRFEDALERRAQIFAAVRRQKN